MTLARFLLTEPVMAAMMARGYWLGCVCVATGLISAGCESSKVERQSPWSTPKSVSDVGQGEVLRDPRAAAHPGGVHLVWRQGDVEGQTLRARHFDARTGEWGEIEDIGPADTAPSVAADAAGNAVVVWHHEVETEGGGNGGSAGAGGDTGWGVYDELVWAARYDSEQERWSEPYQLDVNADGPKVAMHADGSAFAVWRQLLGDRHVYVAHMSSDGTWGRAQPLDSTAEAQSAQTGVVLHADGDATAYLERRVKNADGLWGGQLSATHYSKESDVWSKPVLLQRALWDQFFDVQMTGNDRGDAVLVWSLRGLNSEEPREIYTASYDSSAGSWTEPDELTAITLDEHAYPVWDGVLAMEDDGRTTVVCSHYQDDMDRVLAMPLDQDHAFGSVEPLASEETADLSQPAALALGDGLMTVWWTYYGGDKYKLHSRIFRDGVWEAAESTGLMRERAAALRVAGVPEVGVLAYWVAEGELTTSWHP